MQEGEIQQLHKAYDAGLGFERTSIIYKNMKDPALLKYYFKTKTLSMLDKEEIEGSSPPDVFIGRAGYPNVYVGPLVPPQFGDTSILSTPEAWVGKSIPEIVRFRSMLIRGMHKTKVTNVEGGRVEDSIKELALADKFIYADAKLKRKPSLSLSLGENSQPFGPSAPLRELRLGNATPNKQVQDAYSDTALKAGSAILELYGKGVLVSKIQKALSAGLLGKGKGRKFVPTRWSITAVDDTISLDNLKAVKQCDYIDSIRLYENVALDNRWIVIMVPGAWSYELVEAWYPKTTWNLEGEKTAIFSSSELYEGRKEYAEIGGCYYAARLAVSELLKKEQKQASVVILREAHPGYTMPMGVWNVREHVRDTIRKEPMHFSGLSGALLYTETKMDIPMPVWIKNSSVLRYLMSQRRLFS
ncbi:MAG: hypothetical protein KGH61_05340 [Candidatus Micrarchaeota archaeon]|nr:hypothetical protein [Candidatus Micrarchaeota archaeon]MDE1848338.1 hypothetical protein [Candidatus Micrarchaeota archaeon]MDE1864952.1 hypothetical protein [Candidatus Micrarchaeota archaeon]